MSSVEKILVDTGYDPNLAKALFPDGLAQVAREISVYFDIQMKAELSKLNPEEYRIRDRVKKGVEIRLKFFNPHKESLRNITQYWLKPWSGGIGAKSLWKTSDIIWEWAGDTATDYNRYTKRSLLCGVLASTILYWLQDDSPKHIKTVGFLDRRIENVLQIGKVMGRFKKPA